LINFKIINALNHSDIILSDELIHWPAESTEFTDSLNYSANTAETIRRRIPAPIPMTVGKDVPELGS